MTNTGGGWLDQREPFPNPGLAVVLVNQESANTWSVKWEADATGIAGTDGLQIFSGGEEVAFDGPNIEDGGVLFEIVGTLLAPAYMVITPPTEITFDGGGDSQTYYQLDIVT